MLGAAVLAVIATQIFGFRLLTVSSDSMSPAFGEGDIIVVRPVAIQAVSVGDVVLFEGGGDDILTVHRVVGINEVVTNLTSRSTGEQKVLTDYRLVTQGDANPALDAGEVTATRLRGRVWFSFQNPLSTRGVPFQMQLFALAGVAGSVWVAWEIAARR